jgi:hypothetical protein
VEPAKRVIEALAPEGRQGPEPQEGRARALRCPAGLKHSPRVNGCDGQGYLRGVGRAVDGHVQRELLAGQIEDCLNGMVGKWDPANPDGS